MDDRVERTAANDSGGEGYTQQALQNEPAKDQFLQYAHQTRCGEEPNNGPPEPEPVWRDANLADARQQPSEQQQAQRK